MVLLLNLRNPCFFYDVLSQWNINELRKEKKKSCVLQVFITSASFSHQQLPITKRAAEWRYFKQCDIRKKIHNFHDC